MKTLIAIRNLPYAEATVLFGGLLANLEDSPVTLMTVIGEKENGDMARAMLEAARSMLNVSQVTVKVRKGKPLPEILAETQEGSYEVIVTGWREVAGFIDALLGTVTQKLAERSPASVLVVKDRPPTALKRLLISTGGQKPNPRVVREGARLARAAGAAVTVLYVTNPVPTMYTGLEAMEETLEELLQTDTPISRHLRWAAEYLAEEGIEADLQLRQGVASDEILRHIYHGNYDLIILGARAMSSMLHQFFMEPVPDQVLERSPCPVLIVRTPPVEE